VVAHPLAPHAVVLAATIQSTVDHGDVLLAVPLAFAAGLVSFFSPCVLPLLPGYVAFLGGATGAGSLGDRRRRSGRAVLGALAFVLGFSFVYVSLGTVFGGVGEALRTNERAFEIGFGAVTIALGVFFAGFLPRARFLNREVRVHWLPPTTVVGAAMLGVLFGIGWSPCIGPTLAAINGLSASTPGATAWRGTLLTSVYCLGLGVPFLAAAMASESFTKVSAFARRHGRTIMVVGGILLIAIGVLEVTGWWATCVQWLQDHASSVTSPI
jgi:cytochrome c-type biogenesis protein